MFVRIGGLDFEPGECAVKSINRRSEFTPRLEQLLVTETYQFEGELIPPSDLDQNGAFDWLFNRMALVESALQPSNLTVAGLIDDRGTETQNMMKPDGGKIINGIGRSFGPIRVSQHTSWGYKDEAEGLTGRTFRFALDLDYVDTVGLLVDFTETITYEGDTGPEFVGVELSTGLADIQQVREKTIQVITQQGRAVGLNGYPTMPTQTFPNLPLASKAVRSVQEPIRRGGQANPLLYPISWRFQMLSTVNQFGA